MKEKILSGNFLLVVTLIIVAIASRLIPHPPNFAPIAAIALFSGAYFSNKQLAFAVPLIALFISDWIIGFHDMMIAVYACFIAAIFIGFMLKEKIKFKNVALAAVVSSVLFFVVTNFAVWAFSGGVIYQKNIAGLLQCYVAAIPFFHNTLLGDLVYSGILFGAYETAKVKLPWLVTEKV
ncbi:MAG: hypothetical protein C0425_02750 [Chlorobiaceae bacterium]|nr:hypothetical protein [Chlorobiaceae bacterium]MBA4309240.1 hypothetical protein [Chlorobiaceae bacterium]